MYQKISQFIVLLAFLGPISLFANDSELADKLNELVNRYQSRHQIQGNILIKKNGETLFEKSFGFANEEWQVPHTPESKFMIASVSKQFTAYAILLLENEGKLSLADSISKYIPLPEGSPNSSDFWESITLYHLLTHTSGLVRDVPNTEHLNRSVRQPLNNIVELTLKESKIELGKLGTFSYSNLSYLLLAKVIEDVSFNSYERFIQNKIFIPARMFQSGEYHRAKMIPHMSEGYFYTESYRKQKRCCDDGSVLLGSHGLYSTARDLALWEQILLEGSSRMNQEVLTKLTSLQSTVFPNQEKSFYGFGLIHDTKFKTKRLWHEGHEWGFVSLVTILPELGVTITVLSNHHDFELFNAQSSMSKINDELTELILSRRDSI